MLHEAATSVARYKTQDCVGVGAVAVLQKTKLPSIFYRSIEEAKSAEGWFRQKYSDRFLVGARRRFERAS